MNGDVEIRNGLMEVNQKAQEDCRGQWEERNLDLGSPRDLGTLMVHGPGSPSGSF